MEVLVNRQRFNDCWQYVDHGEERAIEVNVREFQRNLALNEGFDPAVHRSEVARDDNFGTGPLRS